MKRVLLLCFILFTSIGYSQPMYTIGANTGANSIPFGGSGWSDQRCQFLYIPSEYATVPPGLITKIYFRFGGTTATTDTKQYMNFRVDMGQNNTISLSATAWETGLTTVLSVPVFSVPPTPVNGWIEIALATPFMFDPTKSLVIDTRQTATTTTGTALSLRNQNATGNRRAYAASGAATPGAAGVVRYDLGFDLITCTNPTNVTASGITKTSANITWGAASGAIGYEYSFGQDPNPPTSGTSTTTATNYSATGLTAGNTYYFHIRTKCTAANSPYTTISFTTPICGAVDDLQISQVTETSAQFDWKAIPVADKYEYILTTSSTPPPSSDGTTPTTSTTATASGLTPNTVYNLFIRSRCFGGDSSVWRQYTFSTFSQCMPPKITATEVERNMWRISWPNDPSVVASEYTLVAGLNTPTIGNTVYDNEITLGIPDDGQPYNVYVRCKCYNIFNTSPWARVELRAPTSVNVLNNKVNVEIYPNPAKDKFTIQVSDISDKNARATITDLSGKIIFEMPIAQSVTTVDLSSHPAGIYFVKYTDELQTQQFKLTKM
jgi:hypothetical protein